MKYWILTTTVALVLVSSTGVAGASDDQQSLEQELARVEAQLAEVVAERNALKAETEAAAGRYVRSKATQEMILAIIADPSAFGNEEEVLDLLDGLAVPGTPYGDAAWGVSINWRTGWRNTLFSGVDASIRTWVSWLAEDGSGGGSLWTWSGTAANGRPFELQGIEVSTFDEDGQLDSVMVHYPYENTEVLRRFDEGG